jgi:Ca2+-binding RTX toxin-like protein
MAIVFGTNNSETINFKDGVTESADLILANGGDDVVFGHGGNDVILGMDGNDMLIGGAGADQLDGGSGNHDWTMYYDSAVGVSVSLTTGTGFFGTAEGDTLTNIENLQGSNHDDRLTGDGASNHLVGNGGDDDLTGGGGADHLDGGLDDDTLKGGSGADFLNGGSGIDAAVYSDSGVGVRVDLASGNGFGGTAAGDTLVNIENVSGSEYADQLVGNDADNTLWGKGGNDTLKGGGGADILEGGTGRDTASYDGSPEGVYVSLKDNTASGGHAWGDQFKDIENVTGSAYSDSLTGDGNVNTLNGWGSGDLLAGGGGGDTLLGGAGDDVLLGQGGEDVLEGGSGDDILEGGVAADPLDGGSGIDIAIYENSPAGVFVSLLTGLGSGGHAQRDTLTGIESVGGSTYADTLVGNDDANWLGGGAGDDTLKGLGGADALKGGYGNDTLIGCLGIDTMTGNSGGDTFVWWSTEETMLAGQEADIVMDFNRAEGDLLDFSQIDADATGGTANDTFTFVGIVDVTQGGSFTAPGQIGYFTTATDTYILLNTEVDAGIDYQDATIRVAGGHTVDASWFLL